MTLSRPLSPRSHPAALAVLALLVTSCGGAGPEEPADEAPARTAEPAAETEAQPEPAEAPVAADLPDLVLVTIDACRADRTTPYGAARDTTPNLATLAEEGVVFERAYSPMPLALPAHAAIFTGELPTTTFVRDDYETSLDPETPTLARRLGGLGYRTAAFVGSRRLHAKHGLDAGFDHYDDELPERERFGLDPTTRPAREVVARATDWLAEASDAPVFLFVHFSEPEAPHQAPVGAGGGFEDPYDAELFAADAALGQLVAALREAGRFEDALIAVTSGSGLAFGEHGEEGHGYLVHEPTVRVPLVLRLPGGGEARRFETPVSLIDLFPTFERLGGGEVATTPGDALHRLADEPGQERPIYTESLLPTRYERAPLHALVWDDWKYVLSAEPALYDLASDPDETTDRSEAEPERAAAMRTALRAIVGDRAIEGPPPEEFVDEHVLISRFPSMLANYGVDEVRAACDAIDAEHPGLRAVAFWRTQAEIADFSADRNARAIAALKRYLTDWPVRRRPAKARLEPFSSSACFELGYRLVLEDRGSEAIHPLRDALRVRPRETVGHRALGESFLQISRVTQAVAALKKASRIEPTADLENSLGSIHSREAAFDEALHHYQRAVKLDPEMYLAHANLARAYMFHERWAEAGDAYRRSLEIEPAQPDVQLELAYYYATVQDESLRDLAKAVEGVENAIEYGIQMEAATLDGIAHIYGEARAFDLAVKFAERAVMHAREEGNEKIYQAIYDRYEDLVRKAKRQSGSGGNGSDGTR